MISVIILSYNTREITLKCLEFLYLSRGAEFEVIVVDNASTDGSAEAVAKAYPGVKLIKSKENLGFARGNNLGMKEAKGDLILLLNSDCFVFEDTLVKGVAKMGEAKADVLGCQLLNPDGTLQPSWGYFPTLPRVLMLMTFVDNFPIIRDVVPSIHVRSEVRYQTAQAVDWVMGAFGLIKREVWEKIGGFDEKYFMYGEEMEWMYRMKQAGYKIFYDPAVRAVHVGGASTNSAAKMFISEMRGYRYWYKKHNPAWQQKMLGWVLVAGTGYKAAAWSILGKILGKPDWGTAYTATFNEIKSEVFGRSGK